MRVVDLDRGHLGRVSVFFDLHHADRMGVAFIEADRKRTAAIAHVVLPAVHELGMVDVSEGQVVIAFA